MGHKKNGRPKGAAAVSKKKLLKVILKHDGNQHAAASELGTSQPNISQRLSRNPEILERVESVREQALKEARIDRKLVYGVIRKNITNKKSVRAQIHAIDRSLELMGDKIDSKEPMSGRPVVVMPIVLINGKPAAYDLGD